MRYFLHGGAYHQLGADQDMPAGAIEVPRLPRDGEHWDDGQFVMDRQVAADMAVPAGHIDTAHILKAVEAAVIKSGVVLTEGLVCAEAAALGISPSDLADQIHSKGAEFRAAEVERRKRKAGKSSRKGPLTTS